VAFSLGTSLAREMSQWNTCMVAVIKLNTGPQC